MASRSSKQKVSSWVTSTFDDMEELSSSPLEHKTRKRPRQADKIARLSKKKQQQCGTALWVDLYAPTSLEDLAVHKKKVQEVECWLVESKSGMKGRKFLLLTGPAGCGKSATVRLLAQEAKLTLLEWINPTTTPYKSSLKSSLTEQENNAWIPGDTVTPVSQTSQFWEFLVRGSKYKSVCGMGQDGDNLVCVEDFPNVFTRDPAALHAMLRQYNKLRNSRPIVFIMTDSTQQSTSVKHLFPLDLQQELSFINIAFNPIASGLLVKALSRVMSLESAHRSGPLLSRKALTTLANTSGGDIRSAINAIQFATKKDVYSVEELFMSSSNSRPKKKTLSRAKSQKEPQSEKSGPLYTSGSITESQPAVGGKDASLFLFRALGKVLYCKRDLDKGVTEPLPDHLKSQERPPLQENPESIYEKASMGAASFGLFLHQNCMSFFPDIESVAEALTHLTHADVMMAEWTGRQMLEDYAGSVTVRGLMHANQGSCNRGGWRPFLRPQWYSVTRDSQSNTDVLKSEYRTHSLTSEELTTVMVPLRAKIFSGERKGNTSMTNKIGLFLDMQVKSHSERLDEQDTFGLEEEQVVEKCRESIRPIHSLPTSQLSDALMSSEQTEEDPEEDFRIDDSDDD